MSCDGTAYGQEAESPDWTQAELELLEAELDAARKRTRLESEKFNGWRGGDAERYETQYPTDSSVKRHVDRMTAAEQDVYEKAHDRHFFDMLKRPKKAKIGHAHG